MFTLTHYRWYYEKLTGGLILPYTLPTTTHTMLIVHVLRTGIDYYERRVEGMMRNGIGHHIKRRYCGSSSYKSMMCTMANRTITQNEHVRYIRATGLTAIALEHALHGEGQTVEGWPIVMPE